MPAQGVDALAGAHVPNLAGSVDGAGDTELRRKVKLRARDLTAMAREGVEAEAAGGVPDLGAVIEGSGDDLGPVRVKVERDDLSRVPEQRAELDTWLEFRVRV